MLDMCDATISQCCLSLESRATQTQTKTTLSEKKRSINPRRNFFDISSFEAFLRCLNVRLKLFNTLIHPWTPIIQRKVIHLVTRQAKNFSFVACTVGTNLYKFARPLKIKNIPFIHLLNFTLSQY